MKNNFQILFFALTIFVAFSCKDKAATDAKATETVEKAAEATGAAYNVDGAASKVLWKGTKPAGAHNGTINVASGSFSAEGNKVTSGNFVIDMTSIACLDLEGDEKAGLEGHLKGLAEGKEDHFFNVTKYPTATFEVTSVKGLEGNADANSLVYGNLTMREITKPVNFKANVVVADGMVKISSPAFKINRTDWGVNYGSKSIFDDLKDKFIDDDIELSLKVMAKK